MERGAYFVPSDEHVRQFYESPTWKRLSYKVKVARGRTCECCGAKAPHVRINTDHIRSVRRYWHLRWDPNNLQILCEDCNLGKGRFDETDFRLKKKAKAFQRRKWGCLDRDWRTLTMDAIQRNAEMGEYDLPDNARHAFRIKDDDYG